jgi:hypothetical protein
MQHENLYPELVEYIFNYEDKFMTADEMMAAGRIKIILTAEDQRERLLEGRKIKLEILTNETRKQMLADGFDAFKLRVVTRIYTQHKNELQLNLCPNCGKLARTPLAKQCRSCFYDWHTA